MTARWVPGLLTAIALVALCLGAVAMFSLMRGCSRPQRGAPLWVRDCAEHRPLADCQRDYAEMNK